MESSNREAEPLRSCLSCGGCAFRSDRPYGNFCSMMCSLRGIPTEAEKKEEDKRWKLIMKPHRRPPAEAETRRVWAEAEKDEAKD